MRAAPSRCAGGRHRGAPTRGTRGARTARAGTPPAAIFGCRLGRPSCSATGTRPPPRRSRPSWPWSRSPATRGRRERGPDGAPAELRRGVPERTQRDGAAGSDVVAGRITVTVVTAAKTVARRRPLRSRPSPDCKARPSARTPVALIVVTAAVTSPEACSLSASSARSRCRGHRARSARRCGRR